MGLPTWHRWGPQGTALNTFGLEGQMNFDPASLLTRGLIWPLDDIWITLPGTTLTTWVTLAGTTLTTWIPVIGVTQTTWTVVS